jgi:hypothetical protein
MPIVVALAILALELFVLAALTATPRGARVGLGIAMLMLSLPAFVAPTPWPWLAYLELALLFAMFRSADFAAEHWPATFRQRLRHLVAIVDTRKVTRVPRHFDRAAFVKLVVAGAITAFAFWAIARGARYDDWRRQALQWYVGGMPLPFAAFALLDGALALCAAALGLRVPPVNRAPYCATSLSEFWSRRWNNVVNDVLREHVYRPLAGRGALVAMTAAFVASAALHAYLIGMLLGLAATVSWTLFFLAQAPLMWLERALGVRRWPRAFGHAWTLGTLALCYPLFVRPLVELLARG